MGTPATRRASGDAEPSIRPCFLNPTGPAPVFEKAGALWIGGALSSALTGAGASNAAWFIANLQLFVVDAKFTDHIASPEYSNAIKRPT
jgi:hypothetical protein